MYPIRWMRTVIAGITVAVILAAPAAARAGDAAELEILGFSDDGRYFAFEQYGNQDGSGAAYSIIDFYDVGSGRYADETRRVSVGGREGGGSNLEPIRAEARNRSRETLDELGIRIGNVGRSVISRPLTDLDADSTSARFSVWTPLKGLLSQDYALELIPHPAKSERCYFDEQPYTFDLLLTNNSSGKTMTLHHDEFLPEERGCALAYRIAYVVVFEPLIKQDVRGAPVMVLLNVFSTGFEGHDMRFAAAGGNLH